MPTQWCQWFVDAEAREPIGRFAVDEFDGANEAGQEGCVAAPPARGVRAVPSLGRMTPHAERVKADSLRAANFTFRVSGAGMSGMGGMGGMGGGGGGDF